MKADFEDEIENEQEDVLIGYRKHVGSEVCVDLTSVAGEIIYNAPSAVIISVDLKDYWNSGVFIASSRQEIVLQYSLIRNNVNIKVGIVDQISCWCYLYKCGAISHTFRLTNTGSYAVFMINETD